MYFKNRLKSDMVYKHDENVKIDHRADGEVGVSISWSFREEDQEDPVWLNSCLEGSLGFGRNSSPVSIASSGTRGIGYLWWASLHKPGEPVSKCEKVISWLYLMY